MSKCLKIPAKLPGTWQDEGLPGHLLMNLSNSVIIMKFELMPQKVRINIF